MTAQQASVSSVLLLSFLLSSSAFVPQQPLLHPINQLKRPAPSSTARYILNFDRNTDRSTSQKDDDKDEDNKERRTLLSFWRPQEVTPPEPTNNKANDGNNLITTGMPDLISFLQPNNKEAEASTAPMKKSTMALSVASVEDDDNALTMPESPIDPTTLALGLAATLVTVAVGTCTALGISLDTVVHTVQDAMANPQASLQQLLTLVEQAGPAGPLYFGIGYFVAEILAIPATPLTMSAGFLFGATQGTITVLIAATFAATFGYVVGKTVLRSFVEDILAQNPKYAKLDKAIGEQGFPLLLLARLTPLFPFSLSNYVYGASSIKFPDYFFGTLLGFAPGTFAYVYTGMVGQALFIGESSQPWYVYAGGLGVLVVVLKLVSEAATDIVAALEEED